MVLYIQSVYTHHTEERDFINRRGFLKCQEDLYPEHRYRYQLYILGIWCYFHERVKSNNNKQLYYIWSLFFGLWKTYLLKDSRLCICYFLCTNAGIHHSSEFWMIFLSLLVNYFSSKSLLNFISLLLLFSSIVTLFKFSITLSNV